MLRDRMDGRMRSIEEIQTIIGMPVLGVVPADERAAHRGCPRAMTVHLDPRSVVAEAYRTIRTAVYFGAGGNNCKTILVTSPEPGDGKTTSASNLAIAIAQTGRPRPAARRGLPQAHAAQEPRHQGRGGP